MWVCQYRGTCWWQWYTCRTYVSIIVIVILIIIINERALGGVYIFIGMMYQICLGRSCFQPLVLSLAGCVG